MDSIKRQEYELIKEENYWKKEKTLIKRKNKLMKEKASLTQNNKLSTSKKLIWFLFINCVIIELVTIIATFKSYTLASEIGANPDLSPLLALIGAVVGEVIGYSIYSLKSLKENLKGGITYDIAMNNKSIDNNQDLME